MNVWNVWMKPMYTSNDLWATVHETSRYISWTKTLPCYRINCFFLINVERSKILFSKPSIRALAFYNTLTPRGLLRCRFDVWTARMANLLIILCRLNYYFSLRVNTEWAIKNRGYTAHTYRCHQKFRKPYTHIYSQLWIYAKFIGPESLS